MSYESSFKTIPLPAGRDTFAYFAQQCTASTGELGSYLYVGDHHRTGDLISPVFPDTMDLFRWAADNGWAPRPGTFASIYDRVK